jgi:hypothetical protein
MAPATAVRQVNARPKGHPGIPAGMATAMGVRREIGQTVRVRTATTRRDTVMATRLAARARIPFTHTSSPATDGIGCRTRNLTHITGNL